MSAHAEQFQDPEVHLTGRQRPGHPRAGARATDQVLTVIAVEPEVSLQFEP